MSRETLDGEGQPVAGEAPPMALDLDLGPADAAPVAAAPPTSAPVAVAPATASGPAVVSAPRPAADAIGEPDPGEPAGGDPDGFSVDLGEERIDRKAAARAAGLPLTSVSRRRVRLAATAAGAVLLLVLTAVGGYSEGQKAQDRKVLATAQVVGQMDQNSLAPNYTDNGGLAEPVLLTLHLTVTASVSGTVSRIVLPTGEARLRSPVRLGPGPGVDAQLQLSNLCGPAVRSRPDVTDPTVTLSTTGGDEVTLPLRLGFEQQFLSRESLCGPTVSTDGTDVNAVLGVQNMWATTSGDLVVMLESRSGQELRVAALPSVTGSAGVQGWQVAGVPPRPVLVPRTGSVKLVVRLGRESCFPDGTLPQVSNLVALRISAAGVPGDSPFEVDGIELTDWNDSVVASAAAARMAVQCGR